MSFARKGALVSIATRKLQITGEKDLDYTIDGHRNGVLLHTADTEQLTKGKKHVILLTSTVRPADRTVLVKVNNELHKSAVVTGTSILDPDDTGEIVLSITPRVDLNLGDLDYIVKLVVEGMA